MQDVLEGELTFRGGFAGKLPFTSVVMLTANP